MLMPTTGIQAISRNVCTARSTEKTSRESREIILDFVFRMNSRPVVRLKITKARYSVTQRVRSANCCPPMKLCSCSDALHLGEFLT